MIHPSTKYDPNVYVITASDHASCHRGRGGESEEHGGVGTWGG
jgi:hypothetical protein